MRDPQSLSEITHFEPWKNSCQSKSTTSSARSSNAQSSIASNQRLSELDDHASTASAGGKHRQSSGDIYVPKTSRRNGTGDVQPRYTYKENSRSTEDSGKASPSESRLSVAARRKYSSVEEQAKLNSLSSIENESYDDTDHVSDVRQKGKKTSSDVADFLAHTYDDANNNDAAKDDLLDRRPKSHRITNYSSNRKRVEKERSIPDDQMYSLIEPYGNSVNLQSGPFGGNDINKGKFPDVLNDIDKRAILGDGIKPSNKIQGDIPSNTAALAQVSKKSSFGQETDGQLSNPVSATPYKLTLATVSLQSRSPNTINNSTLSLVKNGALNQELQQLLAGNMTSSAVTQERIALNNMVFVALLSSIMALLQEL